MRAPLVWLNLILATILGLLVTQRNLFIPPPPPDFVLIAAGPQEAASVTETLRAAQDFQRDFRRRVRTIQTGSSARDIALALKEAIALNPQGISMPGHVDESLLLPFVLEAQRRGIPVTFHSAPFHGAQRQFAWRGAGYAGTRSALDGALAAEQALNRFQFDPDMRVIVAGADPEPRPESRAAGCFEAIRARGGAPEYIQYVPPDGQDLPGSVLDLAAGGRNPDFVFWDAGPAEPAIAALVEAGVEARDVVLVSFTPVIGLPMAELMYVKQQFPERNTLGAYLSLVQLHMAIRYGTPGLNVPLHESL